MATGPCEILERNEECPDSVKGLSVQKESTHQWKEDRKEDAKAPTNKEEVNGTPNGIEREGGNKLHIIDKDLDEFVDSMTEVTPEMLLEAEKDLDPEEAPEKLYHAEQVVEKVVEKVLKTEKMTERVPHVEELPGTEKGAEKLPQVEKMAEKVPRAEKIPEKMPRSEKAVEKTPRPEKPAEKARPAASKTIPTKRKAASSSAKDTLPWEGLTLNKCLLVASLLALLSVGCQVVQDILDFGEDIPVTEPGVLPTPPESSPQDGSIPGELEELWFYERWLNWSDDYEPPELEEEEEEEEEELEPVEIEEEEEEPTEIEEKEEEPTEEEEEEEEEESTEEEDELEEPIAKAEPRKSREKLRGEVKAGKKEKALKVHKAHEKEEKEKKHPLGKHHRREGSERGPQRHQREEGKGLPLKHEAAHFKEHKRHPRDEGKWRHKEGHDRSESRHPRREQDSKHHPHEFKGRKPWQVQRPFFSQKDKFGKHKFQEGKRHD